MAFDGFPPAALCFLRELADHNDREWFQAHRAEYETLLLEPARDFVEAMAPELARLRDDLHADPRVNGSILRINRDTRFSPDKRPYKTHLDLWFWQGEGPSRARPGFGLRLTAERLGIGVGKHHFEPDLLARYRDAVVDPRRGADLAAAVRRAEAAGYGLGVPRYKRVPAGYDPSHPRADLLRRDGLFAGTQLVHPAELHTSALPGFCAIRFAEAAPLVDWLADVA
jgi:uncharacterized protein (TIGR02453 family)